MKNLMTTADQKLFDEAITRWQKTLNLMSWRFEKSTKPTKELADVTIYPVDRLAVYAIGKDWGSKKPTPETINEIACHEALHVLLRPYQEAVKVGGDDVIMSAEHDVIMVLLSLLKELPCSPESTSSSPLPR